MIDVTEHLKLVNYVIKRYFPGFMRLYEYEDLYQQGCLGLVKAAKGYKPSKGTFANFAVGYIKGYINMMYRDDRYIPNPTREKVNTSIDSLNRVVSRDKKEVYLQDVLKDKTDCIEKAEQSIIIKQGLSKISDRERTLVIEYFLNDKTQTEIAAVYGTTQVNISRIISNSLKKMRSAM